MVLNWNRERERGLFSVVTMWCVNHLLVNVCVGVCVCAGVYLCIHIKASCVSAFWPLTEVFVSCILLKWFKELSIVPFFIHITCHIWPSRDKKITGWLWLIFNYKAETVFTFCSQSSGHEEPCGMSGRAGCIQTQTIPIRCLASLMNYVGVRDPSDCVTVLKELMLTQTEQCINSCQHVIHTERNTQCCINT